MKVEIRHGRKRTGITQIEQAVVVMKPGFIMGWFKEEERRLAIHRWGQGWRWEDTNKPCPAWIELELNKEVTNVH